ncbi:hypothetical protein QBC43DRAFT_361382 [Cladorrhinum sp. PSN259]|nr:hypothetical protein QBC43DRAFT_361382 [Cladorrhinum sp. PSN259]
MQTTSSNLGYNNTPAAQQPPAASDATGNLNSHHLNSTATNTTATTENTGERVARNIKGVVAQGHICHQSSIPGLGESLRGNIMSGIDSLVGDKQKQPEHEAIARGGEREFMNKEFERKGTMDKAL